MSKTIDERVVSMQFDNRQFEKNVATSMSTLEKLKQSLNFNGAAKGLQEMNAASKNINMSGLGDAVQTVTNKFSALQVMGVTALANIANQAVNAGKRIMSALTIQPITTGFNEYELKMDSVRTIMASTGESVGTVNKYLNELNEYSDQTIYSFADMTQNIGKFTNAGVKLEDAVMAIKGISNEAAVSGANANEASRAMYNFAQALSAGYVKLIDWKSIENANMATVEFKQQLIDTAVALGTVTKETDGMYKTLDGNVFNATKNFNEVLNDQWMTSEVLVSTLKDYADETTDIGKKAKAAATEVTKFSQVFDILKETAQSGWARTWELIFGDIEQAKSLFTPLTNFLTGIIDKVSDSRNKLLEGTFGKNFTDMFENINNVLDKTTKGLEKVTKPTKDAANALKDLSIVDEVWAGKLDTWKVRFDRLTDAGYNYCRVQNEINKRKGVSHRYTEEEIKAQDKLLGRLEDTTEHTEKQSDATKKLTDKEKRRLKSLCKLNDEQLKNLDLSEDQIRAIKELKEQADKLGLSYNEFIDNLDELNGRWLLINSFKNIGEALVKVFGIIGQAWKDAFGFTDEEKQQKLFNLIEKFHAFTEALILNEEAAKRFKTIMDGVMAVLDISWAVFSGSLVATIKLASAVLGLFGTNLAEVAEYIANLIIKFRDWVKENTMFIGMTDKLAKVIHAILSGVKKLFDAFTSLNVIGDAVSKIWNKITEIFGKFNLNFDGFGIDGVLSVINSFFANAENWIKNLDKFEGFTDFINGIVNTFTTGADTVVKAISNFFNRIKTWFKNIKWDEIFSLGDTTSGMPFIDKITAGLLKAASFIINIVKFIFTGIVDFVKNFSFKSIWESGKDMVMTLMKGIEIATPELWKLIKNVGAKIVEIFEKIDLGTVLAGLVGFLTTKAFTRVLDIIEKFANPLDKLGGLFESFSKVGSEFCQTLNAVQGVLKGFSLNLKAKAIKDIAISIGILAASIAVLALLPAEDVKAALSVVLVLIAAMAALVVLVGIFGKTTSGLGDAVKGLANIAKASGLILAVSVALLAIAGVAKLVAGIEWGDLGKAGAVMTAFGALVSGLLWATKLADEKTIKDSVKIITKISWALLLLSFAVKIISGMSWEELGKAGAGLGGLFAIISILTFISGKAGSGIEHAGKTIRQIAVAMLLLVVAAKLIVSMEWAEMEKAAAGLAGLSAIVAGLVAATRLAGGNILDKTAGVIAAIGACMLLLAIVAKIINTMSWEEMGKAAVGLVGLGAIVAGLVAATKLAGGGDQLKGVAKTILMMSLCIGVLAGVAIVLGYIDLNNLAKGVIAVGLLGATMAMLVRSTKDSQDVAGTLTRLIIAIGLLAVVVVILSNIEDTTKLLVSVGSMIALMLSLSVLIKSTKSLGNIDWKPLVTILAVAVVLGLIVAALSNADATNALPNTIALSVLMLALSVSMKIMSGMVAPSGMALVAIGVMTLVVAALGGVLYMLQGIDPAQAMGVAIAIAVFLGAMEVACILAAAVGALAGPAITGLTILVAFVGALGLVVIGLAALAMDVIAGMPKLGADLSAFMTNVQPFVDGVQNIPEGISDKVGQLCSAILKLTGTELLNSIAEFLSGGSSLADLGAELKTFGESLGVFSGGSANIDTVISVIGKIKEISITSDDYDISGLTSFGNKLTNYSNKVSSLNYAAISASITSGLKLAAFVRSLAGLDASGASSFNAALSKLAQTNISGFIEAFTSATSQLTTIGSNMLDAVISGIVSKQPIFDGECHASIASAMVGMLAGTETFGQVGCEIIDTIVEGVQSSAGNLKLAVSSAVAQAVTSARKYYSSFSSAGAYCVSGFVNGIKTNQYKAASVGSALAAAALRAAIRRLDENSPSKEFYKVGDFAGLGFINALTNYESTSYEAGSAMAGSAIDGLTNSIAKIKSAIDSDIDVNPTIRPVLDLSNIQNGANSINGMFGNRTLVLAGVNAGYARLTPEESMADMMSKMQKMNDDSNRSVVNAITNLRGDFGSLVEAIGNMHIRMDSGTVVGELIGKIDSGLGRIATHKGRGI